MSRQYWSELLTWTTSDGSTISNTTSENAIYPGILIPANFLQDGRALRISARGRYSIQSATTIRFRVRLGNNLIADSGNVNVDSVSTGMWKLDVHVQTRLNGPSGSLLAMGDLVVFSGQAGSTNAAAGSPAHVAMGLNGYFNPSVVNLDLTTDMTLSLTVQFGAAHTSTNCIGMMMYVEAMN